MRLLGQGSNVLVRDEGVPGLVVQLSAAEFGKIEVAGRRIVAGGGAILGRVVTTAVHRGLAGLETLIGIPGTLGGALHGNAGTHGGNVGQWATGATVITAAGEVLPARPRRPVLRLPRKQPRRPGDPRRQLPA